MRRPKSALLWLAPCVVALWLAGSAGANPYFAIHTEQQWADALGGGGGAGGAIVPVEAEVFQQMVLGDRQWPAEYLEAKFFTPTLFPERHADSEQREEPALVMQWGEAGTGVPGQEPPQPGDRVAAAWDYVYREPADLNGTVLDFSIHAPFECMYVSLNILDAAGNYREWIWHAGFEEGEIPPCVWTTVRVNPVTGWSNYEPEALFTHGAGFDLSNIQWIRFDENGIWSDTFPPPWTDIMWNAWDHVQVTPEPGTIALLGGGLAALAARRRKRRKA